VDEAMVNKKEKKKGDIRVNMQPPKRKLTAAQSKIQVENVSL
jgi:hypothetical protein